MITGISILDDVNPSGRGRSYLAAVNLPATGLGPAVQLIVQANWVLSRRIRRPSRPFTGDQLRPKCSYTCCGDGDPRCVESGINQVSGNGNRRRCTTSRCANICGQIRTTEPPYTARVLASQKNCLALPPTRATRHTQPTHPGRTPACAARRNGPILPEAQAWRSRPRIRA
jgi:hypothetical protein